MYFKAVLKKAFLLASVLDLVCCQTDLTIVEGAKGTEVVLETVSLIQQSGIFLEDNKFLRRVAYVESRDGLDPDTFRDGYCGGIWQVNEDVFQETSNVTAHPVLLGTYENIKIFFDIEWLAVRWQDLRRPLLSVLAARIFFQLADGDIPGIGDLRGQGSYWKSTGFNTNPEDTVDNFTEAINALELKGELSYTQSKLEHFLKS